MKTARQHIIRFALLSIAMVLGIYAADAAEIAQVPFDYFVNNWNVVGRKDYARGARVTPDNAIFLAGTNTAVRVRYGRALTPLSRQEGKVAYQVMELEEAGLWDAARKSVELYLPRQRPDGRFESQAGQLGEGGHALGQYRNTLANGNFHAQRRAGRRAD
jgi:hypothetical protein